jgi:hypothetical protein
VFLNFNFPPNILEEVRVSSKERGMGKDVFGGILARLVEPVHVELTDETVDVLVPEEDWQNGLLE